MTVLQVIKSFNRFEKISSVILLFTMCIALINGATEFIKTKFGITSEDSQYVFVEGEYGTVKKINPLYTTFNNVDSDISSLVFCGLSKYDSATGEMEEDVATHTLDSTKTIYTFKIKENAVWHDKTPITTDDVIYTYNTIIKDKEFQNISLKNTFKNVEIKKIDNKTIEFILKSPNSYFFTSLNTGILPYHLLKDETAKSLPQSKFNLSPIGCGPYSFEKMDIENKKTSIHLKRFRDYYETGGNISSVLFYIYPTYAELMRHADSMHGISKIPKVLAKSLLNESRFKVIEYTLPQYTALFLNMDKEIMKSKKLRLAISKTIQKQAIVDTIGYKRIIDTPLLELKQEDWINKQSVKEAMGALFDDGWKLDEKSKLRKDKNGKLLVLDLLVRKYEEGSHIDLVTKQIVDSITFQLKTVGIALNVMRLPLAEFEDALTTRKYDVVLYGQNLGYSTDTYAYWHSSQAGDGYNLSNYRSSLSDSLIERIRNEFDDEAKKEKLNKLAEVINDDIPAVFLYSPSYYYFLDNSVKNVDINHIGTPTDRLSNLYQWIMS